MASTCLTFLVIQIDTEKSKPSLRKAGVTHWGVPQHDSSPLMRGPQRPTASYSPRPAECAVSSRPPVVEGVCSQLEWSGSLSFSNGTNG